MLTMEIHDAARKLYDAHGPKAIAEAAQKAVSCEESGNQAAATDWRKIEALMRQMRGPLES